MTQPSSKKQNCKASVNSDFNEKSKPANQNGRNAGPVVLTKEQRKQLIQAVANRLPAYDSDSFQMGEETITPTTNQKTLKNLLDEKTIIFVNGPFGSGKTFWTCLSGLYGLADGKYNKISLTAPAVEADEKLGFMPGDKNEKMNVHVNQILETIEDLVGKDLTQKMLEGGVLEIAPHAFNRGRTYKKTFYILDESQNASARQLMTSIGRLGSGSKFVYMGDDKQNDRTTSQSAYVAFTERFTQAVYAEYTGSVTLGKEDVKRHPFLQLIVAQGDERPLDGFEESQDAKIRSHRPNGNGMNGVKPQTLTRN